MSVCEHENFVEGTKQDLGFCFSQYHICQDCNCIRRVYVEYDGQTRLGEWGASFACDPSIFRTRFNEDTEQWEWVCVFCGDWLHVEHKSETTGGSINIYLRCSNCHTLFDCYYSMTDVFLQNNPEF